MKNSPKVVIVLLTYQQLENTLNCIESINKISYPNYDVILVNNYSQDNTEFEVIKKFPKTIVINSDVNLGCSKGRNKGIDYAIKNINFKYMVFLDNDTEVKSNFLDALVSEIEHDNSVGLVYPKVLYLDHPNTIQHAGFMKFNFYTGKFISNANGLIDNGIFNSSVYSEICSGTCILLLKELVVNSAGFDRIFDPYGYEDLDFILRATKGEAKIKYCPEAVIYHKESRTPTKGKYNKEFAKLKARNLKIFMKRHASKFQLFIFYFSAPFQLLISFYRLKNFSILLALIKSYLKK